MDSRKIKLFHLYIINLYDWNWYRKSRPVLVAAVEDNRVLCFKITSHYFQKDPALQANYYPSADWRIEHLRKVSYVDMNSAIWVDKYSFKSGYNKDVSALSSWDTKVMLTAALQHC